VSVGVVTEEIFDDSEEEDEEKCEEYAKKLLVERGGDLEAAVASGKKFR